YLADCEDSYQAYNGKDPAPALNRVYVEAFESAAKAAGLERMARALSSEGRIALDMKPWIEAGWDVMPQAYWNAYAVYQPSKCIDFYTKEAGWPIERIHPTIGTFTSEGEKRVVTLEQYAADLGSRGTVGFSFYLPESYLTQTNISGYEQLGRMSGPPTGAGSDSLDEFIEHLMVERDIPGLSLAIVHGGEIVKVRGYGFADRASRKSVTASTLFQAASVSKPVAALAALRLVDQGKLSLDADVNSTLTKWKVPQNEFTKSQPVTLRRILSHRAGFILHGFPGYAVGAPLPSLEQILDGAAPANTHPVRVYNVPGSKYAYSGGGYVVMQEMLAELIHEPLPRYFEQTVLEPFGMTNSTFAQPLDEQRAAAAATGYGADGRAVDGKWHIYPELAAAGLWTTATDLARFAMGIQRSLAGTANPVLPQALTGEMLTDQGDHDGLGLFLQASGKDLRFWHSGRNDGFDTLLMALAHRGDGAVVMINRNDDSHALAAIFRRIAQEYHWAGAE
ncbi:MAG TPA: serine hydrolase domain-containing protein, partial [Terriglobales bacterium]|nr:serine hydrolase domain-containing protein [Terriglobales bacterium]